MFIFNRVHPFLYVAQIAIMKTTAEQLTSLKARVDQLEHILNSINDGFFTLDAEFNFTYVNQAFERICNLEKENILGINYWEVFPLAKDLKFWPQYNTAFREQKTVHFEEYATNLGKWVQVNAYPNVNGLSVYFTDITEMRESRLTIQRQNAQLKEIAQIQSHKVRKPVAHILGLSQLLDTNNPTDPANIEIIKGIVDSCHELDSIIKKIDLQTRTVIGGEE